MLAQARLAQLQPTVFTPDRGVDDGLADRAARHVHGGFWGPFLFPRDGRGSPAPPRASPVCAAEFARLCTCGDSGAQAMIDRACAGDCNNCSVTHQSSLRAAGCSAADVRTLCAADAPRICTVRGSGGPALTLPNRPHACTP